MNKSKEELLKKARQIKENKLKTIEYEQIILKNDTKRTLKNCKQEGQVCVSCKCTEQKGNTGS